MAKLKFMSQFAKTLSRDEVLVPHLNNYFFVSDWPNEFPFIVHPNKEQDNAFHPSSATKCMRTLYAERRGDLKAEMHPLELQKTFLFGHFFHAALQWIIVEGLNFATWSDVEREYDNYFKTEKGNEMRVRGFTDIARCVIPNEGTFLVDIKTINARLFSKEPLPDFLLDKYKAQVRFYLEFEDLDEAIILCCEKDSPHRFKEVRVTRDGEFVDSILEDWEDVVDMEEEGIIPSCTCFNPEVCPTRNIYNIDPRETAKDDEAQTQESLEAPTASSG